LASVDPNRGALSGSQEGTAHLPLAVLNPGLPFARSGLPIMLEVYLASGQIYPMPLRPENGFCPEEIPLPAQSRMMVLSYPHPTAAIAPFLFKSAVAFCQQHNLVLVRLPLCRSGVDDAAAPRFCKPTQKNVSMSSSPIQVYNMEFRWLRHWQPADSGLRAGES